MADHCPTIGTEMLKARLGLNLQSLQSYAQALVIMPDEADCGECLMRRTVVNFDA